jgi:hypothetical protein
MPSSAVPKPPRVAFSGVKAAAHGIERAASATAHGVRAAAGGVAHGASAAAHGVDVAASKVQGVVAPGSAPASKP